MRDSIGERPGHATTAVRLAAEFSRVLRSWLDEEEMDTVIELNRTEQIPNICHSHDFCDANEAMLAAFVTVTGRDEPSDLIDEELWSDAWLIARLQDFDIERITGEEVNT